MNEIKLSGILGEVEERTSGNGVRLATARLRFNAHGDTVLLVAADARLENDGLMKNNPASNRRM